MSWTDKQRRCVVMACSAAGWNDQQRYMVMLHCGCPLDPQTKRPSVKHPRNTSEQMAMVMSFAEPVARDRGRPIAPPRDHPSWHAAVADKSHRLRHKARAIVREAAERVPSRFDGGLERFVVEHVAESTRKLGSDWFADWEPESIDQCDAPTIVRVIECLRSFVGREMLRRGITPETFTIPASARRAQPSANPSPIPDPSSHCPLPIA